MTKKTLIIAMAALVALFAIVFGVVLWAIDTQCAYDVRVGIGCTNVLTKTVVWTGVLTIASIAVAVPMAVMWHIKQDKTKDDED